MLFAAPSRAKATKILRQGLYIAQNFGMQKLYLNINSEKTVSIRIFEKLGAKLLDTIEAYNKYEGNHLMCRYIISLNMQKEAVL